MVMSCAAAAPQVAANRRACVKTLLARGAKVNSTAGAQSSAPIHIAARDGNIPVATLLLEHGADVNVRSILHPSIRTTTHIVPCCRCDWGHTSPLRSCEVGGRPLIVAC